MTQPDLPHEAVVQIQHLAFGYGPRKVLDDLSLRISPGAIVGVLGANGSGKTTLFRLLVGRLKPRSGELLVFGQAPSSLLAHQLGYMPQLTALYSELSAQENVDFFARMYGQADPGRRRQAVESVLRLVALWERRREPVLHLSGGMRQRVSLAIALVHSPPLLVLDEPTVGLDPELRVAFWDHFRDLVASGTTLLLSSHTMDDAAHCHRLVFLQDGRIIADGSPGELRAATGRPEASLEEAFLDFVRKGQSS